VTLYKGGAGDDEFIGSQLFDQVDQFWGYGVSVVRVFGTSSGFI